MPFSFHRQLKLVHLVRLGFALMLLCMMVTFSANLVANTQYQATTDRLIGHLFPARSQAKEIARLALAIDDTGALYVLSNDPTQQAQLLQTYQQDAQALRVALSSAATMADTAEQRSALSDFTYYFFGNGGYYDSQQAFAFAQKRAGQDHLARENYVHNPFLSSFQDDIQVYTDVVNREIAQEDARLNSVSTLVRFLNIGLGGSACLFGIGIVVFITRSIGRLYRQIEEKNTRLAENNTLLQALSTTDPLTELPNHRALLSTLKQELERAQRYDRPCSLLFLDLDHFKALNDSYGHAAGDTVLCAFAGVLSATIRNMDTAGRWGGEEFVVILPEATAEDALDIAERIRKAVSFSSFEISGGLHLTCSVGVACYPEHGADQDALLTAADQAMYGAKRLGRNQVRMVSDPAIIALLTTETAEGGREETALHGTVDALVTLVEKRDWSLGHHSQQVADLLRQLALAYGMSLEEAQAVALAGQLHDIGKVAIPDAILQKPGPLTEEEREQMRRHSIVGAEVISCIPSLRPLAPVIRAHHERWDGQGYPDHLQSEQIPLAARLIAVVDSYTVMITDRPYQLARPQAVALVELQRCAGSQFDPRVVEAFISLLQGTQDQSQREVASVA
jgi:diguanylate cyclase (GGDEF)-like protein